ncbi:hypothetical protein HDU77_008010 [Chytriomyces hyalinus]|nr:hypothetical protein HDU77_008010 [Chytriomyces hyalinus]
MGSRVTGSSKHNSLPVFGYSLESILAKDAVYMQQCRNVSGSHIEEDDEEAENASSTARVPIALIKFLKYLSSPEALEREGLFRVAAPVKAVRELRDAIEKAGSLDFSKLDPYEGINVVAALLKQWIREIPDGIVPKKYFQPLLDAGTSGIKLQSVIQTLPKPNRDFLQYIMRYLFKVAGHSSVNLMKVNNLVIVFAPTLFRCPNAPAAASIHSGSGSPASAGNPEKYLVESMQVTKIMAALMDNFETIFKSCELQQLKQSKSSRASLSKKASKDEVDEAKSLSSVLSSTSTKVNSSSGKSLVLNEPTLSQREMIDDAVARTIGSMLFTKDPSYDSSQGITPVGQIHRTSATNIAIISELKKRLSISPSAAKENRDLEDQEADELSTNEDTFQQETKNYSVSGEGLGAQLRPKPPSKRAPAPPQDTSNRIEDTPGLSNRDGMVFDDSFVIKSRSTDSSTPDPPMTKKKSVTFSNPNISSSRDLAPKLQPALFVTGRATPPPPNRPAPAAPTHSAPSPMPGKLIPSHHHDEHSSINDGDDELSYQTEVQPISERAVKIVADANSDDESEREESPRSRLLVPKRGADFTDKPIGSIGSSVSQLTAHVTSSDLLSPTSSSSLNPVKVSLHISPPPHSASMESHQSTRIYSSSPNLERLSGSNTSSGSSIQRRSTHRAKSGGSPRRGSSGNSSGRNSLMPLGNMDGDSARTLGSNWKSEGRTASGPSSNNTSAFDLPTESKNSPYLNHRKKKHAAKDQLRKGKNSTPNLTESAKDHSGPKRASSLSSQEPFHSLSNGLCDSETDSHAPVVVESVNYIVLHEEFRQLRGKLKLLKNNGCEILKADRLRYKQLSGILKDRGFQALSDSQSDSLNDAIESSQDTIQISGTAKSSLERLARKRLRERRPKEIKDMSMEQILEEKTAVKRELAHLKAQFKEDSSLYSQEGKEVMRELYARYCELKSSIEARTDSTSESSFQTRDIPQKLNSELERYAILRHEKKMLQLQLHNYQNEFIKRTGRRVKTAEDRAPVQGEYQRYKELRQSIEDIESRLKVDVNALNDDG